MNSTETVSLTCVAMRERRAKSAFPVMICLGVLALALSGCASTKGSAKPQPETLHERGWIGGQFRLVKALPPGLQHTQNAGILILSLSTNTPAREAGLSAGDLILELNHETATDLRAFRRTIDHSDPGAVLPIKAWREGQTLEYNVRVGREKFKPGFSVIFGLPFLSHTAQLWPQDGFSLIVLGYKREPLDERHELHSPGEMYLKAYDSEKNQPIDSGWETWLVIVEVSTQKLIDSQDIVAGP